MGSIYNCFIESNEDCDEDDIAFKMKYGTFVYFPLSGAMYYWNGNHFRDNVIVEDDGSEWEIVRLDVISPHEQQRQTKQVIVVRKDLNMRKGKIAAQVSHATLAVFLNRSEFDQNSFTYHFRNYEDRNWLSGKFTKIVVYVNSERELLDVYERAKANGLLCSIIQDVGDTEFHGVPTYTTVAVGPAAVEKVDLITKGLPLL